MIKKQSLQPRTWSLLMATTDGIGSPVECAKREVKEETGLELADNDLNIFGYVSEKDYEGLGHC